MKPHSSMSGGVREAGGSDGDTSNAAVYVNVNPGHNRTCSHPLTYRQDLAARWPKTFSAI
jgi:hypothetical protein